jgi:hypothetical protein
MWFEDWVGALTRNLSENISLIAVFTSAVKVFKLFKRVSGVQSFRIFFFCIFALIAKNLFSLNFYYDFGVFLHIYNFFFFCWLLFCCCFTWVFCEVKVQIVFSLIDYAFKKIFVTLFFIPNHCLVFNFTGC